MGLAHWMLVFATRLHLADVGASIKVCKEEFFVGKPHGSKAKRAWTANCVQMRKSCGKDRMIPMEGISFATTVMIPISEIHPLTVLIALAPKRCHLRTNLSQIGHSYASSPTRRGVIVPLAPTDGRLTVSARSLLTRESSCM